jgi:hypothetical protein
MKYFSLIASIMFVCSFSNGEKKTPADQTYDVWSDLINSQYIRDSIKQIVIKDSTTNWWINSLEPIINDILEDLDGINAKHLSELMKINKQKTSLEPDFNLKVPYDLITEEEFTELLSNREERVWTDFYRRYPDCGGLIEVALPLFYRKNRVLVYVEQWVWDLGGSGNLYIFKKARKHWKILAKYQIWT